jgi:hypothetical protein
MTTQRELELAVLAYSAYQPSNPNKLPLGAWTEDESLAPGQRFAPCFGAGFDLLDKCQEIFRFGPCAIRSSAISHICQSRH